MKELIVYNHLRTPIYVMAEKDLEWVIMDFLVDAAMFTLAVGEIRCLLTADIPAIIRTGEDIRKVLCRAAAFLLGTAGAGGRPAEAVVKIVDYFKTHSVEILPRSSRVILEKSALDYLSSSGIAELIDTRTLTLTVMAEEGKKLTKYATTAGMNWKVLQKGVVRANDENAKSIYIPEEVHKWWKRDRIYGVKGGMDIENNEEGLTSSNQKYQMKIQEGSIKIQRNKHFENDGSYSQGMNAEYLTIEQDGSVIIYDELDNPIHTCIDESNPVAGNLSQLVLTDNGDLKYISKEGEKIVFNYESFFKDFKIKK